MARLELQVDRTRSSYLRRQIDWCQYRTVERYVDSPKSPIQFAYLVDSSVRLEHVGVIAWSGDQPQWAQLMQAGLVQPVPNDVPKDASCYVIYMPPAYLVQILE